MSMAFVCHGAETEKTYQDLAMQRVTIKDAAYSDMSKLTKLALLEEAIRESAQYKKNVKERRALSALQHRVQQDQQVILKKATGAE